MQLRGLTEKCFGVELSLRGLGWLIARDPCVLSLPSISTLVSRFLCQVTVRDLWSAGTTHLVCDLALGDLHSWRGRRQLETWMWAKWIVLEMAAANSQQLPPQKHPVHCFAPSGWEQSCGDRLKAPGKAGGQELTAATSGKAPSAQPFALRIPKFFHKEKKKKDKSHINDGIDCVCPVDSIRNSCSSSPQRIAGVIEEESCCSVWTTLNHREEPRCVRPPGLVADVTDISLWSRVNHPMQIPVLLYALVCYSDSHTPIAWSVNIPSGSFGICLDTISCFSLPLWLIVWLFKHFQSVLVCGERHQQW